MTISIELNETDPVKAVKKKAALEAIANSVDAGNLEFLAELAKKPGINAKLSNPVNRLGLKAKL